MYNQIPWTLNEFNIKNKKARKKNSSNCKPSKRKKAKVSKDKCFNFFGWQIIIKD